MWIGWWGGGGGTLPKVQLFFKLTSSPNGGSPLQSRMSNVVQGSLDMSNNSTVRNKKKVTDQLIQGLGMGI